MWAALGGEELGGVGGTGWGRAGQWAGRHGDGVGHIHYSPSAINTQPFAPSEHHIFQNLPHVPEAVLTRPKVPCKATHKGLSSPVEIFGKQLTALLNVGILHGI